MDDSPQGPLIVAYVSGHGFGHAVRTSAILNQLAKLMPGMRAVVKTTAPPWLFGSRAHSARVVNERVDTPPVQADAFVMDIAATIEAMCGWMERKEGWLLREVAWLCRERPSLVLADICPLALEAAERAGIHSALIANFTWEWILRNGALNDDRAHALADELAACTSRATWCFLTWPHLPEIDHPRPVPVGLVGQRCDDDRREVRRALEIPEDAVMALLTFGGMDTHAVDWTRVSHDEGILYLSTAPRPGLTGCRCLGRGWRHACLVHAADVVVGKLGYCTVAEALVHGTPYLFAPREHWAEERVLREALERHVPTARVPWDRFTTGLWTRDLLALAELPRGEGQIPYGTIQIAHILASALRETSPYPEC